MGQFSNSFSKHFSYLCEYAFRFDLSCSFCEYPFIFHCLHCSPSCFDPDSLLLAHLWLGLSWIDSISANKRFSSPKKSSRKPYTSSKQQERQKHSVETTINFSEDGKLYRNGKLLIPESRVLELCEAWHHHMLHPGVKKEALEMQRRFEIDQIGLYTAIKKVRKGCSVCQACNPDNRNVKGEAQWTPVPDQPMESVAMDVFSMPEVHIGKETFDCVVLCVDRHSGYVVAVPARTKGLLAKEVAVMMIRHWLTVFDIPLHHLQ